MPNCFVSSFVVALATIENEREGCLICTGDSRQFKLAQGLCRICQCCNTSDLEVKCTDLVFHVSWFRLGNVSRPPIINFISHLEVVEPVRRNLGS